MTQYLIDAFTNIKKASHINYKLLLPVPVLPHDHVLFGFVLILLFVFVLVDELLLLFEPHVRPCVIICIGV